MAEDMEVIDRIRSAYRLTNSLMRIVWLNVGIFVLLRIIAIAGIFSGHPSLIDTVLSWIELPSSPSVFLTRPWTLVTYMFVQYELLHIVFNMLWLYWFGTIFLIACDSRRLVALYFYGGIAGGLLYMAGYAVFPLFVGSQGVLIGSSASVIAIVTAVAVLMPGYRMYLLFFGSVRVKWIAVATIVLVLVGVTGTNAGGEVAHLGGVAVGLLLALRMRKGHDITSLFSKTADALGRLFDRHPAVARGSGSPFLTTDDRRELDDILDKIKKSGYQSLTPQERDRLFDVSRKIK